MTGASHPTGRLVAACQRTLLGWQPPNAGQEELRARYVEHLARHADGWSRECRGAHLTASSLICAPHERQVLLTLHARLGRWLQTGGHLELDDASLECAAAREATEESGLASLTLDAVPLLLSRHELRCGGEPTFHLDVQFLVVSAALAAPAFGDESLDVRWFPITELPEVDDSVTELVEAAAGRLGWV